MAEPFIAEIRVWACTNYVPRGWTLCNGQLLPIAQNSAVYAVVGWRYGGDGRKTFGVPNLQSRAPMHSGAGRGLSPRRLADSLGAKSVALTADQIPYHSHALRASTGNDQAQPGGNRLGKRSYYQTDTVTNNFPLADEALSLTGGGQAHENRQPYLGINFCFALTGVFPSRN